jgi:hypothetical protein
MMKLGITDPSAIKLFSCPDFLYGKVSDGQDLSPIDRDGMLVHINLIIFPKVKGHFDT